MRWLTFASLLAMAACTPDRTGTCGADGCPDGAAPDLRPAQGPGPGPTFAFECTTSLTAECGCWPPQALKPGMPTLAHCGPAEVGAPSQCCAIPGWQTDPTAPQECECMQLGCAADADECACRPIATLPQGAQPVASCTGTTCCKGGYDCTCWVGTGFTCFSDQVEVPSCAVSDLTCGSGLSDPVPSCA